ncbi:hypothetical protein Taro_035233 [Colocasia esculenta]|uniref:Uncharacterized protein n=1 Tax=Colocasia esculenta TaxID=4460 RepID=A0A843VYH2_COLES|nr:hypothetical protein [Colocasia esculenta]
MGRRPTRRNQPPHFTDERAHYSQSQILPVSGNAEKLAHIQHMEKAFHNAKDAELDQSLFQRIAREMNVASRLTGHRAIQWRQVKVWHERHVVRSSSPAVMSNVQVSLPDFSLSNNTPESSSDIHRGDTFKVIFEHNSLSINLFSLQLTG